MCKNNCGPESVRTSFVNSMPACVIIEHVCSILYMDSFKFNVNVHTGALLIFLYFLIFYLTFVDMDIRIVTLSSLYLYTVFVPAEKTKAAHQPMLRFRCWCL